MPIQAVRNKQAVSVKPAGGMVFGTGTIETNVTINPNNYSLFVIEVDVMLKNLVAASVSFLGCAIFVVSGFDFILVEMQT